MASLFPELPENLSERSDEELSQLYTSIQDGVAQAEELAGDLSDEQLSDLQAAAEAADAIRTERATRAAAAEERRAKASELLAKARGPEPEEDPEDRREEAQPRPDERPDQPSEPQQPQPGAPDSAPQQVPEQPAEPAPQQPQQIEAVAAGGNGGYGFQNNTTHGNAQGVAIRTGPPAASKDRQPAQPKQPATALVASAIAGDRYAGKPVTLLEVASAMIEKKARLGMASGYEDEVVFARARWSDEYPEERSLTAGASDADAILNRAKADAILTPEALTAAGGLCAPVTPLYDVNTFGVTDRPVRDSLPSFNAERGGIRFAAPPLLSAVTTGVGVMTAANDAAGGTTATKTCQTVPCPSFSEVDIAAIYSCLRYGNLPSRTFPEMLEAFIRLVGVQWARVAEGRLLDRIKASSTAVPAVQVLGAISTFIPALLTASVGMRSRHRLAADTRLRILLPMWTPEVLLADMVRGPYGRFEQSREALVALLRSYNIEPTFYLDGPSTGTAQVYPAQAAAGLTMFPANIQAYLFPEGSFLFLDGGTLDIGMVRDSTLNATNDFQIFTESFEEVAFVGPESVALTITLCPTGGTATGGAITCGS